MFFVLKKNTTDTSKAGSYNPGLLGAPETISVNAVTGSAINFFTGPTGTALATAIHEVSHAGGAEDIYGTHGPDPAWNNAHTIENISRSGLDGILSNLKIGECICE